MRPSVVTGFCTLVLGLLAGCAGTTVILMPDEDGKVGVVIVTTKDGARVIDQAYHKVTAGTGPAGLSQVTPLKESEVGKDYANLLRAQPAKPSSFMLYFFSGSSALTKESLAKIPQIIEKIKEQSPTEINVIGHTDTTGTHDGNQKLSLERAKVMEKLLKEKTSSANEINVKFFGSKDLLIATPPNVNEPRNRRVEILIL
jgi:outer membrane protein OmpA-like peptidoglycan-associated protein